MTAANHHQRRQERLRRERISRTGYLLLWSVVGVFLLLCALVLAW
jgi:hypothetical protein